MDTEGRIIITFYDRRICHLLGFSSWMFLVFGKEKKKEKKKERKKGKLFIQTLFFLLPVTQKHKNTKIIQGQGKIVPQGKSADVKG